MVFNYGTFNTRQRFGLLVTGTNYPTGGGKAFFVGENDDAVSANRYQENTWHHGVVVLQNGVNNYINYGNPANLNMSTEMTMELWFKWTGNSTAGNSILMNKEGEYECTIFSDGTLQWAFATPVAFWVWENTNYVVNHEWNHLAITFNRNTVKTYLNGALIHTRIGTPLNLADSHTQFNEFWVGSRQHNDGHAPFNGSIDDIHLYNRALTVVEIVNLYGRSPNPERIANVTILAGTNYVFNNHTYNQSGTYRDTIPNPVGCDSIIITNLSLRANPCAPIPPNGLVARYDFEGNAQDLSGNGYHAISNSAILTTDRFGRANHAYQFNGSNAIQINGLSTYNGIFNNAFTLHFWINPNINFNNQTRRNNLTLAHIGPFQYWYQNGNLVLEVYDNRRNNTTIRLPISFNANTWYSVICVVAVGQPVKFYINGQRYETATLAPLTLDIFNGLYTLIGSEIGQFFLNGKMDDFLIYNRALAESEIMNLYARIPSPTYARDVSIVEGGALQLENQIVREAGIYVDTIRMPDGCDTIRTNIVSVLDACANNIPVNGLKAYYDFKGSANDKSGNGNHGTVNGAILTTDRNGKPNQAYQFNGSSSISVPNSSSLQSCLNESTMSVWFTITGWFQTNADYEGACLLNQDPQYQMEILKRNTGISIAAHITQFRLSVSTLNLNQWYHIVLIKKNGILKVYLDGILVGSAAANPLTPSTQPLYFGYDPYGSAEYHIGKLDNIAIYNRAIDTSEIQQLYNNGRPIETTQNLTICSGQSITVSDTTYRTTGNYRKMIQTVQYQCDSIVHTNLTITPPLRHVVRQTICANESVQINGRTYRTAGLFRDTIWHPQGVNLCDTALEINVTISPLRFGQQRLPLCQGESLNLNGRTIRQAGTYRDTLPKIRFGLPCDSIIETQVYQLMKDSVNLSFTSCNPNEVGLVIDSSTRNPAGCKRYIFKRTTLLPTDFVTISGNEGFCEGSFTTLSVPSTSGFRYAWSTGVNDTLPQIQARRTGVYTVTITNRFGCKSTPSKYVFTNPPPEVTITGTSAFCANERRLLTAVVTQNCRFQWHTGATTDTIRPDRTDNYTVIVSDNNGCKDTATQFVRVHPLPNFRIEGKPYLCEGTPTELTATLTQPTPPIVSYLWSNNATTPKIRIQQPDRYSITVKSDSNCVATKRIFVSSYATVEELVPEPLIICPDTYYTFPNGDTTSQSGLFFNRVKWNGVDCDSLYKVYNIIIRPYEPIDSFVDGISIPFFDTTRIIPRVTSAGCNDIVRVNYTYDLGKWFYTYPIYEGLIPGGTDGNEYFIIPHITHPRLQPNALHIFDKRGMEVYKMENYDNQWSGKHLNGTQLPKGQYYYVIKVGRGNLPPRKGRIFLNPK